VQREYDVIVVGGRVAGSVLAALLGDRGARVLLAERVRFPRSTISTHFFRGAGLVAVLERLGILDEVLALGCPRITREWDFGFGSPGPEEGPPQNAGEAGFGLSVRREPLDALLLERARRSPGVEVAQPAAVRSLLRDGGRVSGVTLEHDGRHTKVMGRMVVGADGRHSLVAREAAPALERSVEPLRTLYYRYVGGWCGPGGERPDAAEFSLNGDEIAYVFPSDDGLACIGVSAPAAGFPAFRADPGAELRRRLAGHPGLTARLERSVAVGRTAGGPPEANWVRAPAGPGWALVGDAGWHQDPWTGEGMDNAALCATSAADAIADWLDGAATEQQAMERYRARREEMVAASFDSCTSRARDLAQLAG
jgi:menaquinone-9 beta-reductase